MKKLKLILPVFMAFVMSFSVVSASACKKKKPAEKPPVVDPDPDDKPTTPTKNGLSGITLNTDKAQLEFEQGEAFSSEGLVIVATYTMTSGPAVTENVVPTAEGVRINSSAYNSMVLGDYVISVSYSFGYDTYSRDYTVTVVEPAKAGLNVTYKTGFSNIIALTTENKTADLSGVANNIEVRQSDENGVVDDKTPIITTGYTVKVFKDKTEVTDLTAVDGGVYQIWVSMPHEKNPSYALESFVLFYVTDPLLSLAKTSTGDTTQQLALTDSISKNWTFEATYVSGKTEQLTIDDVVVSGFDATYMGDNKATVSYSKNDGAGNIVTKTVEVEYSITAPDGLVTLNRAMNLNKLEEKILADGTADAITDSDITLKASNFDTDANKFIKFAESSNNKYRPKYDCIEIRGEALTIVVQGEATLTMTVASTGSKNTSTFGVKDSTGNLIVATETSLTNVDGVYSVTGTGGNTISYTLTAGTYVICGLDSGRNTRVKALTFVDKVGTAPSGESTTTNKFDYSAITPITDKDPITQEMLTGKNAFLTLGSGAVTYRTSNCIEIKNDGFTVTFNGIGTLKIAIASTGDKVDNWSSIAVKDSAGNYLAVTFDTANSNVKATDVANVYAVTTTSYVEFTFEITQPGTYTICSVPKSVISGTTYTAKSNTRIKTIEMVDKTGSAAVEPTEYTFDYSAITPLTDKTAITQEMLTGKNSFLTLGGGTLNYRTSGGGCIEIKDNGLKVTFNGTGTLKIKVASTGDPNWSAIAVKDASGAYVAATYTDGDNTSTTSVENVYAVFGTTYVEFIFNITAAGTYTICTVDSTVTKASAQNTNRNTRINAITMIDNNSEEA